MTDLTPSSPDCPRPNSTSTTSARPRPRIVAELAARHPDSEVPTDPEALADYFTFSDFAHFIEVYLSVVDLIRDPEDVRLLTYEVARDMARQNIRYAELTVTPYSSTRRGIPDAAFMEAIEDARKAAEAELGVMLRWCFDIPGEAGLEAAEETARIACELRPEGLVAFGLGGPEIGVPRPQFKPYFDRAAPPACTASRTPGETTGPQTIWDALTELRAERIGHGTSATQDPKLLAHLAEHRIPLEVCPTSNIATRAVRHARRAPDQGDGRRPASWSPSTATTRRCSAPTSTTSTRWRPACSTSTSAVSPRSPRTPSRRPSSTRPARRAWRRDRRDTWRVPAANAVAGNVCPSGSGVGCVLSACRPEVLVQDVRGLSAGAARVRAGRRDGANVARCGTRSPPAGRTAQRWRTRSGTTGLV